MGWQRVGVGIVGCGMIATAYLDWIMGSYLDKLVPLACADADPERARAFADRFGLQPADGRAALLARDDITIVLNLTNPVAHEDVTLAALGAGKHVFSEKPLAMALDGADRILAAAAQARCLVACAPSIALGAAQRTAWRWVREGRLGTIHEAVLAVSTAGHEHWHPDPRYYYQPGAGPLLDLGVYPLTLATTILGPIVRVWGLAEVVIPEREVSTGPLAGTRFPVVVPDLVLGMLRFESGALGTIHASFATARTDLPAMKFHGSLGSLSIGDFHAFSGPVRVCMRGETAWRDVPLSGPEAAPNWARAIVDLAEAAAEGRRPRMASEHAAHVLEVMLAIERSAGDGGLPVGIERRFPAPMPIDET